MDLKSNELRIGNLIYWNIPEKLNVPHEVVGIVNDRPQTIPISLGDSIHEYLPIQLTPEWLIKLGFKIEKGLDNFSIEADGGSIYYISYNERAKDINSFSVCHPMLDDSHTAFAWHIRYVHQLQNLYFALTKTDLVLQERGEKV